ncbi:MAG: hypothetical protein Q9159_003756 [Coniocarpon cinnabarinum]
MAYFLCGKVGSNFRCNLNVTYLANKYNRIRALNAKRVQGPYNPAVLRFDISFPAGYPFSPPLVTFHSDVFHPLLTPLTKASFSSAATDSDSDGTGLPERLPPGAFSLRHGFPQWYERDDQINPSPNDAPKVTEQDAVSSRTPQAAQPPTNGTDPRQNIARTRPMVHVVDLLRYMRQSFESAPILDSIPFEAAANPGAWYAWRAYRQKQLEKQRQEAVEASTPRGHARTPSKPGHHRANSRGVNRAQNDTPGRSKRPSEWNWEGVWEQRVKRAVQESLTEGALFGAGQGDSEIAFADVKKEDLEDMRGEMKQHLKVVE